MRSLQRYRTLPEILSSPTLVNARRGPWSIILPYARTNLVTNPSIELATTGYTAVGSSIAQSATEQYHGTYSLAVTPTTTTTDGVYYGTVSLISGTTYAYSCKFKGIAGLKYTISLATTGGADLTSYTFTATGRWQWVYGFWTETSSTTRRFYIRKAGHASTGVFYIDGLQVEACGSEGVFATTFIDGDQRSLIEQFPPAYGWNGTRHASTSYRTAQTRDGGRVVNLDSYGFQVTATEGAGLVAPTHTVAVVATIDGAQYQSSVIPPRTIQIAGRLSASTRTLLQRNYAALGAALSLDTTFPRQPIALVYQPYRCDAPIGEAVKVIASYIDGLNLDLVEQTQRETKLKFAQWSPALVGRDQGAALDPQDTTANANGILQRSSAGVWAALGTGASGDVRALAYDQAGLLYAGGTFADLNSVANTPRIGYWDGSAWNAMGTGGSGGNVYAIVVGSDGKVYAGGSFTSMGGVANTAKIAYWDGTWHALGTGATGGDVLSLVIGPDGSVYAGGDYTLMGGVANTVRIAKWNGSAWSALSTGISGGIGPEVDALAIGLDTKLYAAGKFTTAGGTSATSIASWDGSAWAALSSGLNQSGLALIVGQDGRLYVGGNFTTAGGLSANFIASWNGSSWFTLAQSFAAASTAVRSFAFAGDGLLYIGGSFAVSNIPIIESVTAYNGTSFIPADVDLPATATVLALASGRDGRLAVGYNQTGSATAPGFTTLTNSSVDALAYPVIRLTGQSAASTALYQIRNWTTNQILSFNLTILAQEQLTIRCGPGRVTILSNVRGDITPLLLPGSAAELSLLPGANSLALFAGSTSITAIASWAIRYATAAAVEY